jgi:PAS domain S-box-containing protein
VSGTIGEDVAVGTMKAGASDYLMKGHLTRLVPAVTRELREAQSRRERRQAEHTLHMMQFTIDHASDSAFWIGQDGRFVYVNHAACQALGYSRDELLQKSAGDIDPTLQSEGWTRFWSMLRQRKFYAMESIQKTKTGRTFPVEIRADFQEFFGREYVFSFARDITERKLKEQALHSEKDFVSSLVQTAQAIVMVLDPDGRIVQFNPYMEEVSGYKLEAVKGKDWFTAFLPEEDREQARELFRRAIRDIRTKGNTSAIVTQSGERRYIEWYDRTLRDPQGKLVGLLAVGQDVTQRLSELEERNRLWAAVNAAEESIIITDVHGLIEYVNPYFEKMTGFTREDVLGRNASVLKSGKHDLNFYKNMWDTIAAGETWYGHFKNRKKDGTFFEEEAVISPVRDKAGKIVNYVAVKRDITREVALNTQLRHSQKMEAIGRLAGGVAHDFTNILVIILNSAQLAKSRVESNSDLAMLLDQIISAANRSSMLTSELLAFAHQQPISLRRMDVNRAVKGIEEMLSRTLPTNIRKVIRYANVPCYVQADPAQIEQVLIHLAVNASDAMPEGGHFTIEIFSTSLSPAEAIQLQDGVQVSDRRGGSFGVISISDTGCGMSEDVRAHVFEPFFTTKGKKRSTGLGLSTVYGIVRQHEGHITVHSMPGVGTTFKIFLPLVEEGEAEEAEPKLAPLPRGSETVLLVENDLLVRGLLAEMLSAFGYRVLETGSGHSALQMASEHKDIRLLITDIVMQEMDGKTLSNKAREILPQMLVLFTSGYPKHHLVDQGILTEEDLLLRKPFFREGVARMVRQVLDMSRRPVA